MRTDLPIFKRCCFCIPLRYGLIVWGYLKMVPLLFCSFTLGCNLLEISLRENAYVSLYSKLCLLIILLVTEIVFNIILLIAAHKKSYKLFKIYHYFIVGELALFTSLIIVDIGKMSYSMIESQNPYSRIWFYNLQGIVAEISLIVICFYITLLVRSELKKLENENASCNFVNHVVEARCEIVYEEPKRADFSRHATSTVRK